MNRLYVCLIVLLFSIAHTFGQADTLIVVDYTGLLIDINDEGIVELSNSGLDKTHASFYLTDFDRGQLRICNSNSVSLWVDGRLFSIFDQCGWVTPDDILDFAKSDTLFVTVSSLGGLESISIQHVVFEELKVIEDEVALLREGNNHSKEFFITGTLFLLVFLGFFILRHSSRTSYLFQKTFSLKLSNYEFVNTSFFSEANMLLLTFLSLSLSFLFIHLDACFNFGYINTEWSFLNLVFAWLKNSSYLFVLFVTKWIFVAAIAKLFNFRGLKDYQLFDFINFQVFLILPILLIVFVDFAFRSSTETLLGKGFILFILINLMLFIAWFTLKFVNNSPRRKLLIISYLCATEIVPAGFLMGWFLK